MNILGGLAIALLVAACPEAIGHVWEWVFGPSRIKARHLGHMKPVRPPPDGIACFYGYGHRLKKGELKK